MAIPKFLEDLNIISKLGDYPGSDNNLSTAQFKAKFDEAGQKIQNYINNTLLPHLNQLVDVQALLNGILDSTLSFSDKAANAKATGDALDWKIDSRGGTMTGALNVLAPTGSAHAANKEYVDGKKKSITVTLLASGWSSKTQRVAAEGVGAPDKCDVIPAPAPDNHNTYYENVVRISVQEAGFLTFTCDDVPTVNLDVNILILN